MDISILDENVLDDYAGGRGIRVDVFYWEVTICGIINYIHSFFIQF